MQDTARSLFRALFALLALHPTMTLALPADIADGFTRTVLADGLANPVDFEIAADGRIFILDRFGKLWVRLPDGSMVLAADIPVYHESEAGLIGIALDPDFATNDLLYLYYSPPTPSEHRLSRFKMNGNTLDVDSEIIMLQVATDRDGPAHDGGNLEFDGFGNLYIGTGDAAEHSPYAAVDESEKNNSAEKSSSNTKDLRGKILRITPQPDGSYTIPAGNLFSDPADGRPEIYVMGARNPYKFEIDPATNWLFWADIGPDAATASELGPAGLDEINLTKAAGNYGWPYFIGANQPYLVRGQKMDPAAPINTSKWNDGPQGPLPPAQPHWFSKPQPAIALMGGPVYRFDPAVTAAGRLPADFDQHYFYWDFVTSRIWAVRFDDAGNALGETQIAKTATGRFKWLIDIELGPDGRLYTLEYTDAQVPYGPVPATGKLSRLDFTGPASANLALGRVVAVSSTESGTAQAQKENLAASNAVDGDPATRWSSAFFEPQWIRIDLGDEMTIDRIEIVWDPYAWGGSYKVQLSADGDTWTTVHQVDGGDNTPATITFPPNRARHVRIADITRGGNWNWGIAIYELRVFGPTQGNRFADPLFHHQHYQGSGTCALCHGGLTDSDGRSISINNDWSASMMANAVRDPYWLAKVAAELKRNPQLEAEINDQCTRCHAPMANDALKKAGQPIRLFGDGFNHPDNDYFDAAMDGVSCTVCHQIADVNLGTAEGNSGRFVVERYDDKAARPAYGQYPNPKIEPMRSNAGFTPTHATHISESALCATCHDLKTPYVDANGQIASSDYPSHFPEQMVFTEWRNSVYAGGGADGKTCQQCHMPRVEGRVAIATNSGQVPARENFARHTMTGANTTMLAMLRDNAATLGVSATQAALNAEIERTRAFLETAASIDITETRIDDGTLQATVKLTNHTGHKLPGGYPSRRMFIHFTVADADGNLLFESGRPNPDGSIDGNIEDKDESRYEPHYDLITSADQVQIYEPIMADSDGNVTHTLLRAKTYLKDNRLTPQGFDKGNVPADIAVHGAAAGDDDFDNGSDTIRYHVDVGDRRDLVVTAELLYQPLSYGHLQDLFRDGELPQVATFRAMFERNRDKTERLARSERRLGRAGVSSGGGGMAASWLLALSLLRRRRRQR